MKYKLEKSNYDNLKTVKMTCDEPLTKKREIKEPFLNSSSFFYLLCAPAGSGKSTLMMQMLQTKQLYYRLFKDIIYVCPPNSRSTVKDNPLCDLETVYDGLSSDIFDKIEENNDEYKKLDKKNYKQLLIIDDCSSSLKDHENLKMLSKLVMNRRHYSLSIIILVQYLYSVPKPIRSNINALIVFKPLMQDLEILRKEFINMKKDDFYELCRFVFQNKHDNLFINISNNTLYKNLQKIIL